MENAEKSTKIKKKHPQNQLFSNGGLRVKNTTFQNRIYHLSFPNKKTYWHIPDLTQLRRNQVFFHETTHKNAKNFGREAPESRII